MGPTLSRRRLLTGVGCSLAAAPLITPMAFAEMPSDNRLVVIILRGAMDGLDALQPYGDPALRVLRPGFDIGPAAGAIDLTGFHALHPGLGALAPMWRQGQLGFAQAVSTPYRGRRSHFDGQDILEAGTAGEVPDAQHRDGWLNRLLGAMPGATGRTAFAIGRDDMLLLRGDAPRATWAPDARLDLAQATQDLLLHQYHNDPLFRDNAQKALSLSAEGLGDDAPTRDADGALFAFAAARLREESRIAALSLPGWDSHRGQRNQVTRMFRRLSDGILRLQADLGPHWDRTMVVAMTEFGRTAAENGTQGTDHGTGGTLILAGGALKGGRVWGDWPGLAEAQLLDRRDLMPTRDVRAYAAWALRGLFGTDAGLLSRVVFPGLEMGEDPRLTG
ncbi:DUF1501 domain-containing protein [Jannaschia sp. 2305UL9-9]|uniref:DUF1501 domain-containing protein n=1 Tax=Jannaschia sp. 2305UL9-9 TaxID=3121638 RepID=UPI0035296FD0